MKNLPETGFGFVVNGDYGINILSESNGISIAYESLYQLPSILRSLDSLASFRMDRVLPHTLHTSFSNFLREACAMRSLGRPYELMSLHKIIAQLNIRKTQQKEIDIFHTQAFPHYIDSRWLMSLQTDPVVLSNWKFCMHIGWRSNGTLHSPLWALWLSDRAKLELSRKKSICLVD